MAGVALARDGLRRPVAAVLGVAVLVVAGAGWMQTRPLSAAVEKREMVSYLTDPAAHQRCETSDGVRYCAYPGFTDVAGDWRERVETTLGVLPPVAAERTRPARGHAASCDHRRQRRLLAGPVRGEPAARRRRPRVAGGAVAGRRRTCTPACRRRASRARSEDVHGFFLAVQIGAWAVGLPPAPHAPRRTLHRHRASPRRRRPVGGSRRHTRAASGLLRAGARRRSQAPTEP